MGLRGAWARFRAAATEVSLDLALAAANLPALFGPYRRLYPEIGHGDTVAALSVPARGRATTLLDIADFVKSRGRQAAFDAAEGIA